jgi:hypothetical protein
MKRFLLISLTLLIVASGGVASGLCTNNVGLDQYIANYAGINNACSIGDKLFYDFAYSASEGPTGTAPTASQATVLTDPGDGVTNPGIIFSTGGFFVSPGRTLDATITYSVATLSGASIMKGYDLSIAGSHTAQPTGLGSGTVTESFSNAPAGTPLVTSVGPLGAGVFSAHDDFLPWASGTTVTTQVHLQSPSSTPFDIVTISVIQEHFPEGAGVPEPYETLLIGSGLLFFGVWRKRVKSEETR